MIKVEHNPMEKSPPPTSTDYTTIGTKKQNAVKLFGDYWFDSRGNGANLPQQIIKA